MKLFLDTNILIDYYAQRDPFFHYSKLLCIASFFDDVELWASTQSFVDVEYILRKAIPAQTLRKMMASSLENLHTTSPTSKDLSEGLSAQWPDLEDFLIARCAENEGANYLITRDTKGFEKSAIPALTPEQFFTVMETEYGITYDEIGL